MLESKCKFKVNEHPYLVSTYCFKGRDYLVKLNVSNRNTLEMKITDKHTSEDWLCSYDASYIENLTRKTGNYKQFSIFVAMLKSGLLKTSESVSLDLLTFNDLEVLTTKRIMSHTFPKQSENALPAAACNRRYLILIYTVEFDRIHYPLPLEYCGPPDPQLLLSTIRRLEQEVSQLQNQLDENTGCKELTLQISTLEKRVLEVNQENEMLRIQVERLNDQLATKSQAPPKFVEALQNSIFKLEEQVKQERLALKRQLNQFKIDKAKLNEQVQEYMKIERSLRSELQKVQRRSLIPVRQTRPSRFDMFKKSQQKNFDNQPCILIHERTPSFDGFKKKNMKGPRDALNSRRSRSRQSSSSGSCSRRTNRSPAGDLSSSSSSSIALVNQKRRMSPRRARNRDTKNDFKILELEKRVTALQQLLEKDLSVT